MSHVLAIVECRAVFLLAANHLVLSFHRVGRFADLRRVVVETVIHMLHVHHVHVAGTALDQRQLLDVPGLVAVRIARVTHVVTAFGRHRPLLVVAHLQVGQFFLSLHRLLFGRVNVRDLALFIGQVTDSSKFIGVLAVLGKGVGEVGSAHTR